MERLNQHMWKAELSHIKKRHNTKRNRSGFTIIQSKSKYFQYIDFKMKKQLETENREDNSFFSTVGMDLSHHQLMSRLWLPPFPLPGASLTSTPASSSLFKKILKGLSHGLDWAFDDINGQILQTRISMASSFFYVPPNLQSC